MKKLIILLGVFLATSALAAPPLPLRIEDLQGNIVTCGTLKKANGFYEIDGCPEIGALFSIVPSPTPVPTPVPTSVPTATRTATSACPYGDNMGKGADGYFHAVVHPEIGGSVQKCFTVSNTHNSFLFEVKTVNESDTSCADFNLVVTSPTGKLYFSDGSSQPGAAPLSELGLFKMMFTLVDSGGGPCSILDVNITTVN